MVPTASRHDILDRVEALAQKNLLPEGDYVAICNKFKRPTTPTPSESELRVVTTVLCAKPGDTFRHHTMDANHGYEVDELEFIGRADGNTKTPKGWFIFKHLGVGRGICQEDNPHGGLNGGMLDAIGAWPLATYRNYKPDGTYDSTELAIPLKMTWAMRKFDRDIEIFIEECGDEEDGLEIATDAIEAGVDANVRNEHGGTALGTACSMGNTEVMTYLIEHGADVHGIDGAYTPLMQAVSWGQEASVRLLLTYFPRTEVVNEHGQTALDVAKKHDNENIIKMLEAPRETITRFLVYDPPVH